MSLENLLFLNDVSMLANMYELWRNDVHTNTSRSTLMLRRWIGFAHPRVKSANEIGKELNRLKRRYIERGAKIELNLSATNRNALVQAIDHVLATLQAPVGHLHPHPHPHSHSHPHRRVGWRRWRVSQVPTIQVSAGECLTM